jgi:hypothetical protein
MFAIDCVAPIRNSNQLQNGAGSERGLGLYPLALRILGVSLCGRFSLRACPRQRNHLNFCAGARFLGFSRSWGGKTMTDRKVLALASPALRRDVACPTLFRQAKRVNKQRVSQKTVERLISEGLLRWGNASRTFVVLTEWGRALNGN